MQKRYIEYNASMFREVRSLSSYCYYIIYSVSYLILFFWGDLYINLCEVYGWSQFCVCLVVCLVIGVLR